VGPLLSAFSQTRPAPHEQGSIQLSSFRAKIPDVRATVLSAVACNCSVRSGGGPERLIYNLRDQVEA
jgi:hypothetical protein